MLCVILCSMHKIMYTHTELYLMTHLTPAGDYSNINVLLAPSRNVWEKGGSIPLHQCSEFEQIH